MLAAAAIVFVADLSADEQSTAAGLLTPPRIGLLGLFGVILIAALAWTAYRIVAPLVFAARRMAEGLRTIAHGNPAHRLPDAPAFGDIADAANELADAHSRLLADFETAVAQAKVSVEAERNRLAALIAELDPSVLVCNREGRVLLYNAAAERLLRASGDRDEIGLGRSVFAFIDRAVVLHALETMERQASRDVRDSASFMTTTAQGRLLRVRAAPVLGGDDGRALAGYVLLLTDVTEHVDADMKRAALFQGVIEATRAALANIRAAIETLTENPELESARRQQFAAIIRDEAVGLSERLHHVAADVTAGIDARWPLEEMRGEDVLTLARSRIERRTGLAVRLEDVDPALWLRVDSFPLAQALCAIAGRLKDEFKVREVRFRIAAAGARAQLDMIWRGPPLSSETAFAWQGEPLVHGGEDSRLTLAQVMERHGGEVWYQREVPTQTAYFRLLLPLAGAKAPLPERRAAESRPEFYDFDLFRPSATTIALEERRLADLAYTVFDTETTGLDAGGRDEIIAIGAVRIVNARLLQRETFEALVDPRRALSEASIAVHGITPGLLHGQPTIDAVLPRFRRFSDETVLVGHNAAFDMRFLERSEARAGVRFDQPVLDTLLLSAIVDSARGSHSLEECCARLGVTVVGRHTALGDALLTAELFLRLIPLLAAHGIRTLGEARAASEKTYYARLRY